MNKKIITVTSPLLPNLDDFTTETQEDLGQQVDY